MVQSSQRIPAISWTETMRFLDACLFTLETNNQVVLLVGVHVDDLTITGSQQHVTWFKQQMCKRFKMEDLGQPGRILGINIEYFNDGSIHLNQEPFITRILKQFHMKEANSVSTPKKANLSLSKNDTAKPQDEPTKFPYRVFVASLLFLAISTRPDLAFTVKVKELSCMVITLSVQRARTQWDLQVLMTSQLTLLGL